MASKLVYRDAFNVFDRATESDNLIQTYVPILGASGEAVRGVFELYADVNAMVRGHGAGAMADRRRRRR
ncbi:MAG: hypothetical protein MZW92_01070 [Comamonadaceae bacterium]|nr:hypothetical protein [Comamonadaceae bacterium]